MTQSFKEHTFGIDGVGQKAEMVRGEYCVVWKTHEPDEPARVMHRDQWLACALQ